MRLSIAAANRASIVLARWDARGMLQHVAGLASPAAHASGATQPGADHSGGSVAFAYVVNLGSNDVSAYSIDTASGKLKQLNGSPFGAGSAPYGITVDPTGEFAYVPNSGSNNISAYSINATSGALKKVKGVAIWRRHGTFRRGSRSSGQVRLRG